MLLKGKHGKPKSSPMVKDTHFEAHRAVKQQLITEKTQK